jgi:ABC-type metal ion transport system substrate-binding protein
MHFSTYEPNCVTGCVCSTSEIKVGFCARPAYRKQEVNVAASKSKWGKTLNLKIVNFMDYESKLFIQRGNCVRIKSAWHQVRG